MIRTKRLLLREWCQSDREAWAALNADPEVMAHFPATLDRSESDERFDTASRELAERGWGWWAVDRDGEFLGFTGLAVPSFDAAFMPTVEIGWRYARQAWGRGYATE
ncbi:MAG: GNAT family N-acetyltransferase, partial [Rhodoglobus sp.]